MLPRLEAVGATAPGKLGPYELYERLGTGGHACVYRARRSGDPDAADVAIKRLHPHLTSDHEAVQGFGREARIAYLLDHPAIRRIFSLCREPGELFMVMEYVDGSSLSRVLDRAIDVQTRLPVDGILAVLCRLCDALDYAHDVVDEYGVPTGFVHRDISPSNVIICAGGTLKLIDLGVARTLSPELVTNSGLIKGKFGYMAPEVMRSGPFDRRADVFSVGVLAWELLTMRRLFPMRDAAADLLRVRARRIPPPSRYNPACPAALDAILLRALATRPGDRWVSCATLATALRGVAARMGEPLTDRAIARLARSVGLRPRPRRAPRRAGSSPPPLIAHPIATVPPPVVASRRCRRSAALGALGGSIATLAVATLVSSVLFASAPPIATARPLPTPATAPAATCPDAGVGPANEAGAADGEEAPAGLVDPRCPRDARPAAGD